MLTQAVGWAAGVLTLVSGLPQTIRLVRTRDTEGVSSWTYTLWTATAIWWCVWGIEVGAVPTAVINGLCIPVLGLAVVLLKPSRVQATILVAGVPAAAVLCAISPIAALVVASLFLLAFSLPSAVQVLRPGTDPSGVSAGTWALVLVANSLWIVFDIGIGQPLATVPSAMAAAGAAAILGRLAFLHARLAPAPRA